MKTYRLSLPKERRFIIDQYTIRDIAFKLVGVGSVGTRCWVILLEGGSNQDTLILQIKEANDFVGYCALCARTLAHAHAKTGNRFAIAGYLGKNDRFFNRWCNLRMPMPTKVKMTIKLFCELWKKL